MEIDLMHSCVGASMLPVTTNLRINYYLIWNCFVVLVSHFYSNLTYCCDWICKLHRHQKYFS